MPAGIGEHVPINIAQLGARDNQSANDIATLIVVGLARRTERSKKKALRNHRDRNEQDTRNRIANGTDRHRRRVRGGVRSLVRQRGYTATASGSGFSERWPLCRALGRPENTSPF